MSADAASRNEVVVHSETAGRLALAQVKSAADDVVLDHGIRVESATVGIAQAHARAVREGIVSDHVPVRAALYNLIGILAIRNEDVIRERQRVSIATRAHDAGGV